MTALFAFPLFVLVVALASGFRADRKGGEGGSPDRCAPPPGGIDLGGGVFYVPTSARRPDQARSAPPAFRVERKEKEGKSRAMRRAETYASNLAATWSFFAGRPDGDLTMEDCAALAGKILATALDLPEGTHAVLAEILFALDRTGKGLTMARLGKVLAHSRDQLFLSLVVIGERHGDELPFVAGLVRGDDGLDVMARLLDLFDKVSPHVRAAMARWD